MTQTQSLCFMLGFMYHYITVLSHFRQSTQEKSRLFVTIYIIFALLFQKFPNSQLDYVQYNENKYS